MPECGKIIRASRSKTASAKTGNPVATRSVCSRVKSSTNQEQSDGSKHDGVPFCPIGLRMHLTHRFAHTKGYQAQRYHCPLPFPDRTGQM